MPDATPVSPSLSSASDTAHVSSRASRVNRSYMRLRPLASYLFPETALPPAPYPLLPSLPVCEAHGITSPGFRSIAWNVVDLVITQTRRVHRRNHRDPVLDLRRAHLEK